MTDYCVRCEIALGDFLDKLFGTKNDPGVKFKDGRYCGPCAKLKRAADE